MSYEIEWDNDDIDDPNVLADMEAGDLESAHIMAMEEMEDEFEEVLEIV
jgi:hypothetical protein